MAVPTDVNSPLNAPSHTGEHQRVSDFLAAMTTPAWTNIVSFLNGWAQQTSMGPCAYRKINDIVYIRGAVMKASGTVNQTCFVLPAGFRPPAGYTWEFSTQAYSTGGTRIAVMVNIDQNGNVTPDQLGNVGLNNISFSVTL